MSFRDVFALVIWLSSLTVYILMGIGYLRIPEIVLGNLITVDSLVVQFYFRKKPSSSGGSVQQRGS